LVYAISSALGIPSLVPHSLIQLLTGLSNTEETVQDQLIKGGTNLNTGKGLRHAYLMLKEIFHHGGLLSYINKMAARPSKPTDQMTRIVNRPDNTRHHFNQELEFKYSEVIPHRAGTLVWLVGSIERKRACQGHHQRSGKPGVRSIIILQLISGAIQQHR